MSSSGAWANCLRARAERPRASARRRNGVLRSDRSVQNQAHSGLALARRVQGDQNVVDDAISPGVGTPGRRGPARRRLHSVRRLPAGCRARGRCASRRSSFRAGRVGERQTIVSEVRGELHALRPAHCDNLAHRIVEQRARPRIRADRSDRGLASMVVVSPDKPTRNTNFSQIVRLDIGR